MRGRPLQRHWKVCEMHKFTIDQWHTGNLKRRKPTIRIGGGDAAIRKGKKDFFLWLNMN